MLRKYAEAGQVGTLDVIDAVSLPKNAGHRRMARARRYAHRHHFDYTPRRGYIYVRSRAISSRCNDNFDEFPASEIKAGYRTFIGKPVYVNHHNADIRRARGVIIDAALHEDTNPDGTEDTWAEVLMEVDAVKFPVLAREVLEGNIARTSMGTDVEYSVCTACGNKAYTPADYCQHIPKMKGMKIRRVNAATGRNEEILIAERCYGLGFFENSLLVEDPADPTAFGWVDHDASGLSTAAAKAVIDEAEEIVQAEAFRYDTNHNSYDKPYAGTRPKAPQTSAPGQTYRVPSDPNDSTRGLGGEDHLRQNQQRDDRAVEREHRQLEREHPEAREMRERIEQRRKERQHGQPTQQTHPPQTPVAASRHVEAGQCIHCNPALRATGSTLMCDSHAFQAQYGTLDFPSHNNSTGWFDYPDRNLGVQRTAAKVTLSEMDAASEGAVVTIHIPERHFSGEGVPLSYRILTKRGDRWHQGTVDVKGWSAQQVLDAVAKAPEGTTIEMGDRVPGPFDNGGTLPGGRHSHHLAYGETKAPTQVDTMRAESCPVCGDDEGYNGDKCSVCGYATPPSQFRDPDLTKAREQDLRQDQAEQEGLPGQEIPGEEPSDLQCDTCGETFSAEGDAATGTGPDDAEEAPEEKEANPFDTDEPEDGDRKKADEPDDLSDLADKSDEDLFPEDEDEDDEEDEDEDEEVVDEEKVSDQDPATGEGRITGEPEEQLDENGLEQPEVVEGGTCPVCGEGTLVPQAKTAPDQEPELTEVGPPDPSKKPTARRRGVQKEESTDMSQQQQTQQNKAAKHRSRLIAAVREQQGQIVEQQGTINRLEAMTGNLLRAVASLSIAAGVDDHPHFARLVRQSGLKRQAGDTNNSPSGAPSTSTEEAKKPDATDDVENVGAVPAPANTEVTPEGVTDVNNSDVTVNPPLLDNLQDPTAPVGGTDAVTPAAGDATGATDIRVSNPSNESFDKPGDSGWKSSAKGGEVERFTASLRLARLRLQAGIETGEDLAVAEKIAQSDQTLNEIEVQSSTLASVTAQQTRQAQQDPRARRLVPQAAQRGQGIVPARQQPSLQQTAATGDSGEGREGEDQWLVGDVDPV